MSRPCGTGSTTTEGTYDVTRRALDRLAKRLDLLDDR